jgi:hypothetical protein
MKSEDQDVTIGGGYPFGQLAQAFATALEHDDPETRQRALGRIDQWTAVLKGMASGKLSIGSRAPVTDLPAWVTPEVVRGGFATGAATAASGKLEPWEKELARRAGSRETRGALFAHFLTAEGLAELDGMLTSGAYAVDIPEEAALLTVAWLARAGHAETAIELVQTLARHSDRLRFVPRPAEPDMTPRSVVCRQTVGKTSRALAKRKPNARVETMGEALTVWNPFADELLELWLETVQNDRVGAAHPSGWDRRGQALLERYASLAKTHTRCTKHRKPKENLAILRGALEETLTGDLSPRKRGLLQHAVDSMVARRGSPGTPTHTALRSAQAIEASLPTHHVLARVVVCRLAQLPELQGLESTEAVLVPVSATEAEQFAVPAGTTIPSSLSAVVERTLAATPEVLIARRVIPSAEVLAGLVPRIAAATVGLTYTDERLRSLMAANYEAFRRRRSLLLLNLEYQVRVDELPWVLAVAPFRERSDDSNAGTTAALARLAELAIDAFPATIMPSPLVSELDVLAREAELDLPLVEELAADIFMGTFSSKFLRAAKLAGDLLRDSLYARYYDIDYAAIEAIDDVEEPRRRRAARASPAFDALCFARAGAEKGGFSVAANGTVIEQAQILTTHNLAALTGSAGVGGVMTLDWPNLASRCFDHALVLTGRVHHDPRPLRTVKDLAYAWRQMLFFLTMSGEDHPAQFVRDARERLVAQPDHVRSRMDPALDGLDTVISGGSLDGKESVQGERLLGWTVGPHWILSPSD